MRRLVLALAVLGCSSSPPSPPPMAPEPQPATPVAQRLTADTPVTTLGASFIAPADWTMRVSGRAHILEAPEGGSWVMVADIDGAGDPIAEAWAAFRAGGADREVRSMIDEADRDGWTDQRTYSYVTLPSERRRVTAGVKRHGAQWIAWIADMDSAVADKRSSQLDLIYGQILPKGYQRESFAGRTAHKLDEARIAELGAYIERAREALDIPGVALGVIQDGEVVFAGGFGVRELGKPAKVDADTLFLIASNTKSLTTMMIGKLVDEGKLRWDTPITSVLPEFKLGDAETTRQVQMKHLICACTGLPYQNLEWLLEFEDLTAAKVVERLAGMHPTSKFGALYQYSNPLAAAGGFIAAHAAYPELELGAAYDKAMQSRVFSPLGMTQTTFDAARALRGNHALPHDVGVDGKLAVAQMENCRAVWSMRPTAGAWSNVRDLLKYLQMELANGVLPGGERYVSGDILAARVAAQSRPGRDLTYGMGLEVEHTYGVRVVHHGGRFSGYRTDMMWLPEHGVGAVYLTNGAGGNGIMSTFNRKLLELLFDGKPEADAAVAAAGKALREANAATRAQLTVPADPAMASQLAAHYRNDSLGDIRVAASGGGVVFDFGEWRSPMASRRNADGTVSLVTSIPGWRFELVPGAAGGKRTLVIRSAQHEYVFIEQ